MSSSDFSIEQSDLEKLSDKDKTELRQFFANEEQRSRIQSRMFIRICYPLSFQKYSSSQMLLFWAPFPLCVLETKSPSAGSERTVPNLLAR